MTIASTFEAAAACKMAAHRRLGLADDRLGLDRDTGRAEACGDSVQVGGGHRDALLGCVGDPHQHKRRSRHDDFAGNVQSTLSQDRAVERDQEPIERRLTAMLGRRGADQEDRIDVCVTSCRATLPSTTRLKPPRPWLAITIAAAESSSARSSRVKVLAVTHDRLDLQAGPGKLLLNPVQIALRLALLGL